MRNRIILLAVFLTANIVDALANATYTVQDLSDDLSDLNSSYILPIVGAGLAVYAIVTGILRLGKIRKGGEEQTDAILNWLGSLVWPVVAVVIGEGILIAFTTVFGSGS